MYLDAALHAIREVLGVANGAPIPTDLVNSVKMGTTVATNALLEKKGDSTLLAVTTGFRDIIEIGYQSRPRIFNVNIKKPDLVYDGVIEISERILSDGSIEKVLDEKAAYLSLQQAFEAGCRSVAIVLMHAFKFANHELRVAALARRCGFTQVSASHPAVIASIGMLAGFCRTLLTPMAANYNIVPASLLELDDRYGVIKTQVGTAVLLLLINTLFIYIFALLCPLNKERAVIRSA